MKKTTLMTVFAATLLLAGAASAGGFHPIADADNYWDGGQTVATITTSEFHPIADADNYAYEGLDKSSYVVAEFHPIADADNYTPSYRLASDDMEVAAADRR